MFNPEVEDGQSLRDLYVLSVSAAEVDSDGEEVRYLFDAAVEVAR